MTSESQESGQLPFAELLTLLRQRGLPIGVRDYLAFTRLLDRFEGDAATLKESLAALLSRNAREAAVVRDVFDTLYAPREGVSSRGGPLGGRRSRVLRIAMVIASLAIIGGGAALFFRRQAKPMVPPIVDAVQSYRGLNDHRRIPHPPARKLRDVKPNNRTALAVAAMTGSLLFVCLYAARLWRQGRQSVHDFWTEQAATLPPPADYDLDLDRTGDPFPPDLLDDVARLLNRRTALFRRRDLLDVNRTIGETLRAGFAPKLIMRAPRATTPIVVLEDLAEGGRAWRWRTRALLRGLERRGVPIEWWLFNGDASTIRALSSGDRVALAALARQRADSPLIVVSAGDAAMSGDPEELAGWVKTLADWRDRVWIHPLPDSRHWRSALRGFPLHLFPMSASGLLAAAREVSQGSGFVRQPPWSNEQRAVAPLDLDRLRWLLALAPRRDAQLLDVLRRTFFPFVPLVAVGLAFDMPRHDRHLNVGPEEEAVHAAIADILDRSARAPEPSGGAERLRLDIALQRMHVAMLRDAAVAELRRLAAGPLIVELLDALRRAGVIWPRRAATPASLVPAARRVVESGVLPSIRRRARADRAAAGSASRLAFPSLRSAVSAIGLAVLVVLMAPPSLRRRDVPDVRTGYQLRMFEQSPDGPFRLEVRRAVTEPGAPSVVELYRDQELLKNVLLQPTADVPFDISGREHWYYVRAIAGERTVYLSQSFFVASASPAPPPLPVQSRTTTVASGVTPPATLGSIVARFVDQDGKSLGRIAYPLRNAVSNTVYEATAEITTRVPPGIYEVGPPEIEGITGNAARMAVMPGAVERFTIHVKRAAPTMIASTLFEEIAGTYVVTSGAELRLESGHYCEGSPPGKRTPNAEHFQTEVVITREGSDYFLTMKGVGGQQLPQLTYRLKVEKVSPNDALFSAGEATAPWGPLDLRCAPSTSVAARSSGELHFVRNEDRILLTGKVMFTNDAIPSCQPGDCRTIYRDFHELNHVRAVAAAQ